MKDEEKAEDYEMDCIADVYKDDVCTIPYAYSAQKLEQAYLDGLAEGRKEATEESFKEAYQRYVNNSLATFDMKKALEDVRDQIGLVKENAELKAKLKKGEVFIENIVKASADNPNEFFELRKEIAELKAQIENIKRENKDLKTFLTNNIVNNTQSYLLSVSNGS